MVTRRSTSNTEALQDIADDTGGKAFTAATEAELREVYKDIGSSVGFVIEFREIMLWFVGVGHGAAGRQLAPVAALVQPPALTRRPGSAVPGSRGPRAAPPGSWTKKAWPPS